MNFRSTADRHIDAAHNLIAGAEMTLQHSFTEADRLTALDLLAKAQRYLQRAIDTKAAWDSVEHNDYEEYPDVPYEMQGEFVGWTMVDTSV